MRYRPEQHLRRQSDIRKTREKGRRIECGAFSLFWLPREAGSESTPLRGPRLCAVASTAAVGHAVLRNLAKRRLRELFRLHQDRIPQGVDLMLLARRACVQAEFAEMEKRYLQACERISREAPKAVPAGPA